MSATRRLESLSNVAGSVERSRYDPSRHAPGIVHIGVGAFHRAHQAIFTDDALATKGGDWRITGVSLRSTEIADVLNAQNGLFTLLTRGSGGTSARVVASIAGVLTGTRDGDAILAALADPATRIVTITVTEKAYGIDRASAKVDPANPAIAADLADPQNPTGVIGFLVEGLRRRRASAIRPFAVLCCDNLPDNGGLLRTGTLDFAGRIDPALRDWIAEEVAFPSSMVDRITPAPTSGTLTDAERRTGCADLAAIETEPFSQWVIEDRFPSGRPAWEAGGAIFVEDVAPYEKMKLRMLNGTHSLIAYAGHLSGCRYVRDAMRQPTLARLVRRHLAAAAATLPSLANIDFKDYAAALARRFENPAIAHETYQIAMDGTEKLPQRLLDPAVQTLEAGGDIGTFAFAVAAWMRYCLGRTDTGEVYALRDPQEARIAATIGAAGNDPGAIVATLQGLPGLFPGELTQSAVWRMAVTDALTRILQKGMDEAIAEEAKGSSWR